MAFTFDQGGNATGQMGSFPVQSWTGNMYQVGSVDEVMFALYDVALSFNPFIRGNRSPNRAAVKYVNSPMFLPAILTDYSNPPTLANLSSAYQKELAQLFGYYQSLSDAIAPTHAALYPLLLKDATALRFLGALGLTNAIVGYLDHGVEVANEQPPSARGLEFWYTALMPTAISPWNCPPNHVGQFPSGSHYLCLDDGFTPKAKVVFLGACGIDDRFLAQWHLAPQDHVLIVPQYDPGNVNKELDLYWASQEWQVMLKALGNGSTAQQAVDQGAAKAALDGWNYSWIIARGGDGSVSFKAKPAH